MIKVLLVEPAENWRVRMQALLTASGCRCRGVATREAALAAAKERPPQVVVLSPSLRSRTDGFDCWDEILALNPERPPKLIVWAESVSTTFIDHAGARGAHLVVDKCHDPLRLPLHVRWIVAPVASSPRATADAGEPLPLLPVIDAAVQEIHDYLFHTSMMKQELLDRARRDPELRRALHLLFGDLVRIAEAADELRIRCNLEQGVWLIFGNSLEMSVEVLGVLDKAREDFPEVRFRASGVTDEMRALVDSRYLFCLVQTIVYRAAGTWTTGRRATTLEMTAAANRRSVTFRVCDAAPTMSARERAAVFGWKPAKPTGADPRRLQLYGARTLARRLGGDLWLERPAGTMRAGVGNVWALRLPAVPAELVHAFWS